MSLKVALCVIVMLALSLGNAFGGRLVGPDQALFSGLSKALFSGHSDDAAGASKGQHSEPANPPRRHHPPLQPLDASETQHSEPADPRRGHHPPPQHLDALKGQHSEPANPPRRHHPPLQPLDAQPSDFLNPSDFQYAAPKLDNVVGIQANVVKNVDQEKPVLHSDDRINQAKESGEIVPIPERPNMSNFDGLSLKLTRKLTTKASTR